MMRRSIYYAMPQAHCLVEQSDKIIVQPLMDLVESPDGLVVYCNVPGVTRNGLELTVDKDALHLLGRTEFAALPGRVHALEFGDVIYEAHLTLPLTVDETTIDASLRDGVLTVFLPFPRHRAPRRIPVTKG